MRTKFYLPLLFIFIVSLQSCLYRISLPESFDTIEVTLNSRESEQYTLVIDRATEKRIFKLLNKSRKIPVSFVIKEVLSEGEYLIVVTYNGVSYSYTLINSENLYDNYNEIFYKNRELLEELRIVHKQDS